MENEYIEMLGCQTASALARALAGLQAHNNKIPADIAAMIALDLTTIRDRSTMILARLHAATHPRSASDHAA